MSYPQMLERFMSLLPLRSTVERIDPKTTAVITFGDLLPLALEHYSKKDSKNMPCFILFDWQGGEIPKTYREALEKYKHLNKIVLFPITKLENSGYEKYCLFSLAYDASPYKYSIDTLLSLCVQRGIDSHLFIDSFCYHFQNKTSPLPAIGKCLHIAYPVYEALADDESKESYLRALKAIMTGDPDYFHIAPYPQYQHPLVQASLGDTIFEGGLFDAYSSIRFANTIGENGRVVGFEPVRQSYENCCKNTENYPNIKIEPYGLWSEKSTFFINDVSPGSAMSTEKGAHAEECSAISLDSYVLTDYDVSLLKLDIEGAEMECLKGAHETISRCMPKLQISVYHSHTDYFEIPHLIMKNYPDYKLYFGHHCMWFWESVLYAIKK